jgi:hypothetical protein
LHLPERADKTTTNLSKNNWGPGGNLNKNPRNAYPKLHNLSHVFSVTELRGVHTEVRTSGLLKAGEQNRIMAWENVYKLNCTEVHIFFRIQLVLNSWI